MPQDRSIAASAKRISRTLVIVSAIALSLLAFPSVFPWMLFGWLLWHTVLVLRHRPGYLPLLACLAVMIVKLVPRTPMILLFALLLVVVALLRFSASRRGVLETPRIRIATALLGIVWGLVAAEWRQITVCNRPLTMDPSRPVVCLGDSLTQGLLPDRGYPEPLQSMIRVPVINRGVSGISTSQGLGELPRVLANHPQVVVIELGGHDFLKGRSRGSTKANLESMIGKCRAADAEVVLMEIPRGFMFDPFASLEREIAYEQDVQLVADSAIRQLVLWSPIAPPGMWFPDSHLSDDGIHSNPRGSKAMTAYVADALKKMYGEQFLK